VVARLCDLYKPAAVDLAPGVAVGPAGRTTQRQPDHRCLPVCLRCEVVVVGEFGFRNKAATETEAAPGRRRIGLWGHSEPLVDGS